MFTPIRGSNNPRPPSMMIRENSKGSPEHKNHTPRTRTKAVRITHTQLHAADISIVVYEAPQLCWNTPVDCWMQNGACCTGMNGATKTDRKIVRATTSLYTGLPAVLGLIAAVCLPPEWATMTREGWNKAFSCVGEVSLAGEGAVTRCLRCVFVWIDFVRNGGPASVSIGKSRAVEAGWHKADATSVTVFAFRVRRWPHSAPA